VVAAWLLGLALTLPYGGRVNEPWYLLSVFVLIPIPLVFYLAAATAREVGWGFKETPPLISATTRFTWNLRRAWTEAVRWFWFPAIVIGGLSGYFISRQYGEIEGIVVGLLAGLFSALIIGLAAAIINGRQPMHELGQSERPNHGIRQSMINGLSYALIGFLAVTLVASLVAMIAVKASVKTPLSYAVAWISASRPAAYLGLWGGLIVGLSSPGGRAAWSHGCLRWHLWREGVTPKPWEYVVYLNEMTNRLLLERIGSAYRFRHDLLQKHIAQLDDDFIMALDQEAASRTIRRRSR
jgi:hypothetical protein